MTTSTKSPTDLASSNFNGQPARRLTTETKSAFKTTELIVYVASVVAVLVAALITDAGDDGEGFGAKTAWLYVTILTVGYLISRGLAKSGSRERYDA